VDFYPPSKSALRYAVRLARDYEARLHIVHVVPPVRSFLRFAQNTGQIVKFQHDEAQLQLARMAKRVRTLGISTSVEVRFGEIDREILGAIDESKAGLLVARTHGRRGFQRWLLGSVCELLLRRVAVPFLTIGRVKRLTGVPDIKRILITTDFSEGSAEVVRFGFSIAQECQADVTLLHVTNLTESNVSPRDIRASSPRLLHKMNALIPAEAPKWCDIKTRVEPGIPYRVILRVAERGRMDMIVVGTHGKSLLDRTLLGSNAERVIRGAACPVLAVPPKRKKTRK
jgi:nucleotide-binding universal stress UspA family protein